MSLQMNEMQYPTVWFFMEFRDTILKFYTEFWILRFYSDFYQTFWTQLKQNSFFRTSIKKKIFQIFPIREKISEKSHKK